MHKTMSININFDILSTLYELLNFRMIYTYLTFTGYLLLMVGTPGPANLLVMLAASQNGMKSSIGFIFGLIFGTIALNILIGLGFNLILSNSQILHEFFKYLSSIYMIYLAIRSWNSKTAQNNLSKSLDNVYSTMRKSKITRISAGLPILSKKPNQFKFVNGLAVPPLNPKAWVMSTVAWTNFAPAFGTIEIQLFIIVFGFAISQLVLHTGWSLFGSIIGKTIPNNQILTRLMIILTIIIVIWAVTL